MKTALSSLFLLLFVFIGASGCNTIEGVGEDLQSLGRKTEDAAD